MKTVLDVLQLSIDYLKKSGISHPRRRTEEVLSHLLGMPRIELYMQFDRPLVEDELEKFRMLLKRLKNREPWQYIIGEIEFLDCAIKVDRRVLIPRQETEILVDTILKELPQRPLEIWDICTGSGCMGIALKKKRPDCHLILSDISLEALEVAKENARRNKVEVEILQGDLLEPFQNRKADVVVCNPPYIFESEFMSLDREVADWEPKKALIGGLEFYQRLSHELHLYLKPKGKAYFELGCRMGSQVKNLFSNPLWVKKEVFRDWSSNDRYLHLVRQ